MDSYDYIVAMGISTGGPKLLHQLIPKLDPSLPLTYLVVQHMPAGFTKPLADRLNKVSNIEVKEAQSGESLKKGVVYIAPGGKQLQIIQSQIPQILLTEEPPYQGHRPSVNIMLHSLAHLDLNKKRIIVIMMTGMGTDGLEGVKVLKQKQNCIVIAQDQQSSTVYGMPKAIINAGVADYIVAGDDINETIKKIVRDRYGR